MARRILGMRTTNWSSLSTSRASRTSTRLDRGEYEWDIVIIDSNDRPKKRLTIRADDFDGAVHKAHGRSAKLESSLARPVEVPRG